MRVLLVDDEKELVSTLSERLSIRGINADWVTDVEEALKKVRCVGYDLAILDMRMPKMNGLELKRAMEKACPKMKFIFMTGHGSEGTFHAIASEIGADSFLTKPVNLEILVGKMKEVLDDESKEDIDSDWELIGEKGFQFFGKMSASISHEIKNVLAIINENAGLLKDLVYMAEKGVDIEPQRLQRVSDMIAKQINRADNIVKNMNVFAHSVDQNIDTVSLNDVMATVVALSGRFADMKGVLLNYEPSEQEVTITTKPFLLENIIWLCLDQAMDMVGSEKEIGLLAEARENKIHIVFSGLKGIVGGHPLKFPGDQEKALLHTLKGEILITPDLGQISIILPRTI
jgi:DNA-binding response OmpR family regulator